MRKSSLVGRYERHTLQYLWDGASETWSSRPPQQRTEKFIPITATPPSSFITHRILILQRSYPLSNLADPSNTRHEASVRTAPHKPEPFISFARAPELERHRILLLASHIVLLHTTHCTPKCLSRLSFRQRSPFQQVADGLEDFDQQSMPSALYPYHPRCQLEIDRARRFTDEETCDRRRTNHERGENCIPGAASRGCVGVCHTR